MTLIDLDKMRSLGVISRCGDTRTREWRSDDGERHKASTDELGTVTQHSRPMSDDDRQDVLVTPRTIRATLPMEAFDDVA